MTHPRRNGGGTNCHDLVNRRTMPLKYSSKPINALPDAYRVRALFVVQARDRFNDDIPGAEIATADEYLTEHRYENGDYDRIVNLCPCERKGQGYYVSLLGEA